MKGYSLITGNEVSLINGFLFYEVIKFANDDAGNVLKIQWWRNGDILPGSVFSLKLINASYMPVSNCDHYAYLSKINV